MKGWGNEGRKGDESNSCYDPENKAKPEFHTAWWPPQSLVRLASCPARPYASQRNNPTVQNGLYNYQNGRILHTLSVSVQDTAAPETPKTRAIMLWGDKLGG